MRRCCHRFSREATIAASKHINDEERIFVMLLILVLALLYQRTRKHESQEVLSKDWKENHHQWRNSKGQDGRARSYDHGSRNKEITRRTIKVEKASPKAMLTVDGARFDWSFMAEEEVPTNMALMAFSYSENEVTFTDKIAVLKSDALFNEAEIIALKSYIKKLKKEKEDNLLKINGVQF
ncbi:hypothetical protein Tco_0081271 [Tanacetum coccineum]